MKTTTQKWFYGLGAAVIGGGSQAIVSGVAGKCFWHRASIWSHTH